MYFQSSGVFERVNDRFKDLICFQLRIQAGNIVFDKNSLLSPKEGPGAVLEAISKE